MCKSLRAAEAEARGLTFAKQYLAATPPGLEEALVHLQAYVLRCKEHEDEAFRLLGRVKADLGDTDGAIADLARSVQQQKRKEKRERKKERGTGRKKRKKKEESENVAKLWKSPTSFKVHSFDFLFLFFPVFFCLYIFIFFIYI